ncbi:MAG: hypothetical protein LBS59_00635 [Puniceicoccales bacterium]|jgi:RHS repeat-associated protein|nr:hypothetical protein [Puniceicoccales bacterium]
MVTPCSSFFTIPDNAVGFEDGVTWVEFTSPSYQPPPDVGYHFHNQVVFTTTLPNSTFKLTASCTGAPSSASKLIIGSLDTPAETDPDRTELAIGESISISVPVPDAGTHYIEVIFDNEDSVTNDDGSQGVFRVESEDGCSFTLWDCASCDVTSSTPPYTPVPLPDGTCAWLVGSGSTGKEDCSPLCECPCDCPDTQSPVANGAVNPATGGASVSSAPLSATSFGIPVALSFDYSNLLNSTALVGANDTASLPAVNWLVSSSSRLLFLGENRICVLRGRTTTLWFYKVNGQWLSRFGAHYLLTQQGDGSFVLFNQGNDTSQHFNGQTTPTALPTDGLLISETLADGSATATCTYDGSGVLQNTTIGNGTISDTLTYTHSGGQLTAIVFTGQNGSRRVECTYYTADGDKGREGDLQTVIVKDGATSTAAVINKTYYRYYGTTGTDADVFAHAVKFVVESATWDKMTAVGLDPTTADNTTLAQYADLYFEYDDQKRVTTVTLAGGSQTYQFSYEKSIFWKDYNGWKTKTTITRPDNAVEIIFSNGYNQAMLRVLKDSADSNANAWYEGFTYNATGKIQLTVSSAAVDQIDEEWPWLFTIKADAGLVNENAWVAAGAAKDYLQGRFVRRGNSENGTRTKIEDYNYITRTVGDNVSVLQSAHTIYRSDASGGSAPAPTNFTYQFFTGTTQVQQRTTNFPTVPSSENGNDVGTQLIDVFDDKGRVIWKKNERGVITRFFYVDEVGALSQRIDDVDTSQVSDAPVGWETSAVFGLHLTTDFESDFLGRITLELAPTITAIVNGVATSVRPAKYTVYKDDTHEIWSAEGYATGSAGNYTFQTTSPVSITRADSGGKITDTITATYSGSGRPSPTDTFPQSSWLSWSHNEYNNIGQLTSTRDYFLIPASGDGVKNINYYETAFGYDNMGRQIRVQSPGGTITRTDLNVRDLQTATFIGTDDTGSSTDNMKQTVAFEYDNGEAGGNGLLTTKTLFEFALGDTAAQELNTTYTYDWRNRGISETNAIGTATIFAYGNQNNTIALEKHSNGTGGTLVAKSESLFDARGNLFREIKYSVTGGAAGTSLRTDYWRDEVGNIIKRRNAGQRIYTKTVFDGLNRDIKNYACYRADGEDDGPTNDVSADIVIEQVYSDYDAASNVIARHSYKRFHDASATAQGALNGPNGSAPKARISHAFFYFDPIGLALATADFGTNGGTVPSRPDSIPTSTATTPVTLQSYDSAGNLFEITDPEGKVKHIEYDALRRIIKNIENYDPSGATGNDKNKTTLRTYAPDGGDATLTLKNSVTGDQVTTWLYGTTLATDGIATSNLLSGKIFPDDTTAAPDRIFYTYTRQQLLKTKTDQNGTTHTFSYDAHLRPTTDAVTTLGRNVDGKVLRIEVTYDALDQDTDVVSFDAATGGNIVNAVQKKYNGFGQMINDAQEHVGAVTTNTLAVNNEYVSGANNCTTWLATTYPNYRTIEAVFDSVADEILGRPGSLFDSATGGVIATNSYLGKDDAVRVLYNEPNVQLTYLKQAGESTGDAGDQYNGLDRFGRIVDNRWATWTSPVADVDRIQYTYNKSSIRLTRANLVAAAQLNPVYLDELYSYDGLTQITDRELGQLSADNTSIVGTPTQEEGWQFDPAGNWLQYKEKDNGTDVIDQTRTHNEVNEIVSIDSSTSNVAFDPAGNMTTVPSDAAATQTPFTTIYDAWSRLVQVQGGPNNIDISYEYDGFFRRTRQLVTAGTAPSLDFYYNDQWKIVEERIIDTTGTAPYPVSKNIRAQYVYGVRDRNDLIFRDYAPDGVFANATRLYATSDAMLSTTALVDTTGTVTQRLNYTAFGIPTFLSPDFTTTTNTTDWQVLLHGEYYDLDTLWSNYGYRYYIVNNGRWTVRELLGERADINLYRYIMNNAISAFDAYGFEIPAFTFPSFPIAYSELLRVTEIYTLNYNVFCDCNKNYIGGELTQIDFGGSFTDYNGNGSSFGGRNSSEKRNGVRDLPEFEKPEPSYPHFYIYRVKFMLKSSVCETPTETIRYGIVAEYKRVEAKLGLGRPIDPTNLPFLRTTSINFCFGIRF